MKILSLFDGISCARVALEKNGIRVERYFASEVDKFAMTIAAKNFSDTVQVGDVREVKKENFNVEIDLLIGGSPCQDLSIAKSNRQGLKGKRSGLFYEYLRILKEFNPRYFILENVASMPKDARDEITKELGVEPIMIDASLVSAQSRKRLFWTNISGVTQPEDRKILLKDILHENDVPLTKHGREKDKSNTVRSSGRGSGVDDKHNWDSIRIIQTARGFNKGGERVLNGKTPTLSSSSWQHNNKLSDEVTVRKLTPIECERLQCLPDGYTEGVSDAQRYKALGNAFNVDVIAHILKSL